MTSGRRARQLKLEGFTFDMGPSWYWMPDVFERFFGLFDKKVSDYYHLERLDPSYRVYFTGDVMDIPAGYDALKLMFEKLETGSGKQLDQFMREAAYKYASASTSWSINPRLSVLEYLDWDIIKGIFQLDRVPIHEIARGKAF